MVMIKNALIVLLNTLNFKSEMDIKRIFIISDSHGLMNCTYAKI